MNKSKVWSFVFLVVSLCVSRQLLAATYYVAKTGEASNPCTATAPCLAITQAVAKATSPGDVVIVKAGTYVETVGEWYSGTQGKPIAVKAYPGDSVIWRGSSRDPLSLAGAISIVNRSYIRIEGFTFDGSFTTATIRVVGPVDAKDSSPTVVGIEIINNTFTNNGNKGIAEGGGFCKTVYLQGIGNGSSYVGAPVNTISGNRFDSNHGSDIYLKQSSDIRISDNVSLNLKSSQAGAENGYQFLARSIHLGGGSNRNIVERNTISSMAKESYVTTGYAVEGLRLDAGSSNNIFQDNTVRDLDFPGRGDAGGIYNESGCSYNLFQRNIIYNIGGTGLVDGSANTNAPVGSGWINNTVFRANSVIILSNSKQTIVKNNLFVNNGSCQVRVSVKSVSNGGHTFKNNNYFKAGDISIGSWNASSGGNANLSLAQWAAVSGETNALSVDPQFVNPPADFHLRSNSPVDGAGEGGVDMGAYQWPGVVSAVPSVPTGLRLVE
jgi:hypothetical protein